MIIAQKWDPDTHIYSPYVIASDLDCPLYSDDMAAEINCAACGKRIVYGDSYTSMQIHNFMGMGYPVCESCFRAEMDAKMRTHAAMD